MNVNVIYEDNHLLSVVKPSDIPVQADASGALDMLTLLKSFLKEKYNKPGNVYLGLVHRLDRPVGGVMVFAKTSKAASRLSEQIRERETGKTYLTVVHGCPKNPSDRLIHYLLKDYNTNTVSVVSPHTEASKQAILEYTLLKQAQNMSLVEIKLLTGRNHQIRVQMAAIGTPLFGDVKYGSREEKGRGHPALWSYSMSINHPVTKERMTFQAPPPHEFPWNVFK